ncbi:MAG: hypothetical protein HYT72_05730 [Candidatus Aenigmarchaeota archaeon]|nr:hypothetical protein [Candidatus Aenigmarchaeota archaeon]
MRIKKKNFYFCTTLAAFILVMLSSAAFGLGKTVQLNLAFSIGAKDDNLTVGNGFVSAQDSNVTLSIVSSGTATSAGNITAYSATEYMLQLTQATDNNRFLIAFTNGTNQTIINKLNLLGSKKILSRAFGDLPAKIPESFFVFLRLEYDDVDIISRTRWSANPFQLIIRNEGLNDRGIAQVSMELVK